VTIIGNRTLRSILEFHAAQQPNKTFLLFEDESGGTQTFAFREFDERVNQTAHLLCKLGVGKGETVSVHVANSPEFLLLWLACAKMGAIMVPTGLSATVDEMDYIVNHSEARVIVTQPSALDVVSQLPSRCPKVQHIVLARESLIPHLSSLIPFNESLLRLSTSPPDVEVTPSDVCMMLYTSGTTAKPKGVLITNAAYVYGAECMAHATALRADDRHIVALPLFHAAAQCHAVTPSWLVGASIALMERFSASRFFDQCLRYDATAAALFAAPIRMILGQTYKPEWRDNHLRYATYAQNVTQAQWDLWHERFRAPLLQLWGMTETVGLPLINPLFGERKSSSMGRSALGYECAVVDKAGNEVPIGEVGELVAKGVPGVTLMQGYFKNPEATATTLRESANRRIGESGIVLHSGDRAYMDADGYFYFVDRAKDVIKRAGENVSSSEVEAVIKGHPSVEDAAVVGVPDPVRDEAVKAFVILKPDATATEEDIKSWCAERLAHFKVPEFIEFRSEFPRTSVGKIQKHLLRQ
jgi:crotonobetaine/carnitine-CoA ligase